MMAVMAFVGRTTSILEQKTVNNYVASKGIIYIYISVSKKQNFRKKNPVYFDGCFIEIIYNLVDN